MSDDLPIVDIYTVKPGDTFRRGDPVNLGAFYWCFNAIGYPIVWNHFDMVRFAARLSQWSWWPRVEQP